MPPREVLYRWKRRHTCVASLVVAVCAYWLVWILAYHGWNRLELNIGAWKRGHRKHATTYAGNTSVSLHKMDSGMAQSLPQRSLENPLPSMAEHDGMNIEHRLQKEVKQGASSVLLVHGGEGEHKAPSASAANPTASGSAIRWRDNHYVRQHGILPYQRCKSSDFAPG
jgi:hypothetical protein